MWTYARTLSRVCDDFFNETYAFFPDAHAFFPDAYAFFPDACAETQTRLTHAFDANDASSRIINAPPFSAK